MDSIDNLPTLLHASAVARTRAQNRSRYRNYIHYAVVILVIASVFVPSQYAWLLVFCACILQLIALSMKVQAARLHFLSRDAQRLVLLSDSFGREVMTFDVVELLKDCSPGRDVKAALIPEKYYSTNVVVGRRRFAVNIAESTFFSRSLLEQHVKRLRVKVLFYASISLVTLLCVLAYWPNPSRYLLIAAAAAIALVLVDDLETIAAVARSIRAFENVDRRLHAILESGGLEDERIVAAFADYAVASGVSPPVPSDIYAKQRRRLNDLWSQRCKLYEQVAAGEKGDMQGLALPDGASTATLRVFEARHALPSWFSAQDQRDLLISLIRRVPSGITVDAIELQRLGGASGAVVTEAKVLVSERTIGHYVLKFYRNKTDATREWRRLQDYNVLAVDFFPRCMQDANLLAKGGVGFYHANFSSPHEFLPAAQVMASAIRTGLSLSPDNAIWTEPVGSCLQALADIFSECCPEMPPDMGWNLCEQLKRDAPCSYVADLRKTEWVRSESAIRLLGMKAIPASAASYRQIGNHLACKEGWLALRLGEWRSADLFCTSTYAFGPKLAVVVPDEMVRWQRDPEIIHLEFDPSLIRDLAISTEEFLSRSVGGDWSEVDILGSYLESARILSLVKAAPGLCHRDLHLGNIMVANGSFRVIDFFDIGIDFAYSDVCRLQLSSLACIAGVVPSQGRMLANGFSVLMLGYGSEQQASGSLAEWLASLKERFENGAKRSYPDTEYVATLLLEASRQAYYSVCSDRPVCEEWPVLIGKLSEHLRAYGANSKPPQCL